MGVGWSRLVRFKFRAWAGRPKQEPRFKKVNPKSKSQNHDELALSVRFEVSSFSRSGETLNLRPEYFFIITLNFATRFSYLNDLLTERHGFQPALPATRVTSKTKLAFFAWG